MDPLARECISTRCGIALEIRLVDVDSIAGVCRLEKAWNLSSSARQGASTTTQINLSAADVELRSASGIVNSETLNPEQVFAAL